MISKLWLSWEKTSTTEQENRACSDVCWNCRKGTGWTTASAPGQCGPREGRKGTGWTTASTPGRSGPRDGGGLGWRMRGGGHPQQDMDSGHHQPRATTQCLLTPSFLSRSSAPCRKSRDTSSFSSNHWMTKGSNHLEENSSAGTPLRTLWPALPHPLAADPASEVVMRFRL